MGRWGEVYPIVLDFWNLFNFAKFLHAHCSVNCIYGCTVRRYEQLETSPEAIEQELRPAVCEHRQDRACDRESREDHGKRKGRDHTGTHRDEQRG